jgi:hypothetical protein
MRNKFEQLIEYIINDETEKANELFHNVVVEKSREIYNELVAEEMQDDMEEGEQNMDATDDMMGDISADEEGMDQEDDDMGDNDMGDDDMGDDDMNMDDDMGGEEGIEDRVVDLEDALDDLKAEFDRLMADEQGEPEHADMMSDMPEEGVMREYTEKVKDFYKGDNGEGQGVGAGSVGGSTNSKSTVAGKNDMGGTAKNLVQGGTNGDPDGKQYSKPSNQYSKGEGKLPGSGSFENVPGAKAGKTFSNAKKPSNSEPSGTNKTSINLK